MPLCYLALTSCLLRHIIFPVLCPTGPRSQTAVKQRNNGINVVSFPNNLLPHVGVFLSWVTNGESGSYWGKFYTCRDFRVHPQSIGHVQRGFNISQFYKISFYKNISFQSHSTHFSVYSFFLRNVLTSVSHLVENGSASSVNSYLWALPNIEAEEC